LRWLFVKKSLIKFKARIVAKGFMQHFGIDYTETFSPVARYTTIRIFFALCALLSLHVNQMDVDYAFPNADIEPDVEIWCEPIAGMNVPKGKYILLKKALYGLKQAARQWNTDINTYLLSLGFTQLKTDSCMYVRGSYGLGTLVILVLYVDDMGIAAMNMKLLNKVKNVLMVKYSMKDLGEPKKMLGLQFKYSLNRTFISIPEYISKIYQKFEIYFTISGKYRTPMAVNTRLCKSMCPSTDSEREFMANKPYREVVGALLWCAIVCRPDLSYAVNQAAKFNSNPGVGHWEAVQRILLYAYQSKEWGLLYVGPKDDNTVYDPVINFGSWADANFSTDPDTSISVTGNVSNINVESNGRKV
jgi:hypothetical protein